VCRRIGEMSIAVPVILAVLLSTQLYDHYIGFPNYSSEQKDTSQQTDESSSEKDKSDNADKNSSEKDKAGKPNKSSFPSKGRRHPETEHHD
jgi:hypothetical protein